MRANSRVMILRGQRVDPYALDIIDTDLIVDADVPAFISRFASRRDKHSGAPEDVQATIRLRKSTDVQVGDRVTNQETGATYLVRAVETSTLINQELRLDAERISGLA